VPTVPKEKKSVKFSETNLWIDYDRENPMCFQVIFIQLSDKESDVQRLSFFNHMTEEEYTEWWNENRAHLESSGGKIC